MTKISVCVIGKRGRMGQLAITAIKGSSDFIYKKGVGRDDDLRQILIDVQPDIVIDVADATTVYQRVETVLAHGVSLVIGASGLSALQREALQRSYINTSVLEVPNFSLGAVGMQCCAEFLAQYMNEVRIIERHHLQKKDTPSGTARVYQERIALKRGCATEDIPIYSIRSAGVLAEQEIAYGQPGESLRLVHQCIDRSAYQAGLLLALRSVRNLSKWHLGLGEFLPSWPLQ